MHVILIIPVVVRIQRKLDPRLVLLLLLGQRLLLVGPFLSSSLVPFLGGATGVNRKHLLSLNFIVPVGHQCIFLGDIAHSTRGLLVQDRSLARLLIEQG